MKNVIFVLIVISLASCTPRFKNKKIAALRLKDFITTSTSLKENTDHSFLLPYLHGEMAQDIKNMSKNDFKLKFINNKITLLKVEILEIETLDDNNIQILYSIRYTKPTDKNKIEVAAEKVALMTFADKHWKISMIYDLSTKYIFPDALVTKKQGSIF